MSGFPALRLPRLSAFENTAVGVTPVGTSAAHGAGVVETTLRGDPGSTTVTIILAGVVCWFPLLSTARLLINAGPAEAAVRLVGVLRQFEMLQKAVSLGAEMNRKAVEDVARVNA